MGEARVVTGGRGLGHLPPQWAAPTPNARQNIRLGALAGHMAAPPVMPPDEDFENRLKTESGPCGPKFSFDTFSVIKKTFPFTFAER
jgi:hypothetical protein